jgi:hypothetical protein
MIDRHRLFGLLLTDFFTDSPYVVDTERDLSKQQQILDVIILRRGKGRFTQRLPDGLDDLVEHNLLTFKSHQESLDDWALKELIGRYVAYCKLVSRSPTDLLPEERFRLYAVCNRFPHNLAAVVDLVPAGLGVYRCRFGTDVIRIVVVRQLAEEPHNAPLFLFSGSPEQVLYGASHYRLRSESTSTLLYQLLASYQGEGLPMPYTMEDFKRDFIKEHLHEFLQDLTPQQREELLRAVPTEEIERVLEKRKAERPSHSRKPRRKR